MLQIATLLVRHLGLEQKLTLPSACTQLLKALVQMYQTRCLVLLVSPALGCLALVLSGSRQSRFLEIFFGHLEFATPALGEQIFRELEWVLEESFPLAFHIISLLPFPPVLIIASISIPSKTFVMNLQGRPCTDGNLDVCKVWSSFNFS